jgi:hypothetical protein
MAEIQRAAIWATIGASTALLTIASVIGAIWPV